MIPFRKEKLLKNNQRDLPRYMGIRNYLSVGKIYSLWSKRRKDWCFKFKFKGQRALSASRMWIPLTWRIPHILTKWVSFIGSSTGPVRSSPLSGQGTWSPSRFILSIVASFFVYIFTTMYCTWLVFGWSITLFFRTCYCNQVWGYDMPHIYSFRYSYPLTVMFNSIHILGTMCDSSLGVWKNETLSNILLCYR
jgi:hypothetical protein